jgi:hypothetical protein
LPSSHPKHAHTPTPGLFIYELFSRGEDYADLALFSTISLAVTVILNGALVSFVLVRARRKPLFAKWMKDNLVAVGATTVLATTNVTVLTLINSDLFALNATNAPPEGDVWDLAQLGGLLSVLFEDLPQVIISIAFLVRNGDAAAAAAASVADSSAGLADDGVPVIAYMTLAASVLAILVGARGVWRVVVVVVVVCGWWAEVADL